MPVQTAEQARNVFGRQKRRHPARHAQALKTSGAGIVHREMMDLQRQPELNKAETGRLKELRRDWNRNRKYTDAGMSLAGVTTPMGAQDAFMRSTEDFRQLNKPAYNQMYPLTGGFMDYADKGGIWGAMLSGLLGKGKDKLGKTLKEKIGDPIRAIGSAILGRDGIGGAVDPEEATPEILQNYADQTFGPINIHDDEFTDTENWYDDRKDVVIPPMDDDYGDFYINEDTLAGPRFDDSAREAAIMEQNQYIPPVQAELGIPNPQGDFDKFQEYPYPEIGIEFGGEPIPPIVPFNDVGRETGIASMYGQGPMWGETDRRYEDEYRDHVERTGDRMTYEEFERAWERMHALPRGLHFQEPRAGIR